MITARTLWFGWRLSLVRLVVGADDFEARVDEDVVGPVDADVVDLKLAVAQLHDSIDDAAWVGQQGGFGGLIRGGSAEDGAGSLLVARGDLTNGLGGVARAALESNYLGRRLGVGLGRSHDDLRGRDRRVIVRSQYEDGLAF